MVRAPSGDGDPDLADNLTPPPAYWRRVPVDDGFRGWRTIGFARTVLVVVRTVTTLTRLLDILALLDRDHRIQVVFTRDARNPALLGAGATEFLAHLGAAVLPWEQAVRTRFDLAIAASENDALHELDAPILLVPHGIGYQKFYPDSTVTSGMDPARLLHAGRVVPSAIALSHSEQRTQLRSACPQALERAVLVGDPCHDRMRLSAHRVRRYRRVLGTGERRLVVLCSTWGPQSLFGTDPELPARLLAALPADEYQLAAILHPGVWSAHGPWQVRGWLRDAARAGLLLVPPERGWQACVLAADCVVTDAGSTALYAAAADRPLLLATRTAHTTVPGSPLASLVDTAPVLDPTDPRAAIDAVIRGHRQGEYEPVVKQAVELPGRSAEVLNAVLYRLLGLPAPPAPARFPPVPDPLVPADEVGAFVAGGSVTDREVTLRRFPAGAATVRGLTSRHVIALADTAELHELEGASVVHAERPDLLAETLAHWPSCVLASATTDRGCLVRSRAGQTVEVRAAGVAPVALAASAYLRLATRRELSGEYLLRLGHRAAAVRARSRPAGR